MKARHREAVRPSLADSVLLTTYWGREEDLDIEYSLIYQKNVNLILAHSLRCLLNISRLVLFIVGLVS